jgi:hypothetical protein
MRNLSKQVFLTAQFEYYTAILRPQRIVAGVIVHEMPQ